MSYMSMRSIKDAPFFSLTTATKITLVRFMLIGPIIFCIINKYWVYAQAFFLVAALTDFLDGAIARLQGECTVSGALFDAMTDKILTVAVFATFFYFYRVQFNIPFWFLLFICVKEFFQIVVSISFIIFEKPIEIKPLFFGKATMVLYTITMFTLLLQQTFHFCMQYVFWFYVATVGSGCVALLQYALICYSQLVNTKGRI
ncbi:CDP-alcohol phosphatidyltransferase family protein [bacterium]|nr:MAG: CDP-alcohol phosphatidyltransferase family protein [bacterium]